MGRIVKSGNVTGSKYVVAVPAINGSRISQPQAAELDDRFNASFAASPAVDQPAPQAEAHIDWDALSAQAQELIDRAAADARSMIEQAEAAAMELVRDAEGRAQEIEAEARMRGHGEGYAEGLAAGKAAADAEMRDMIDAMHALMENLRVERHAFMQSAEPELVRLAMAIAERVVHEQISHDPNVVVQNVRAALTRLVSREVVTLRVNPADLETMRHHRDAIVASSDVEHLRIVEDQRVDRGGVLVETEAGTIDAKISTQLREARRAIRADDSIAIGPAIEEHVLHPPAQAS